ncbi:OmpA family protein [Flavobacteriaceae bacterium D16]|nr:OmpA family protein [Flavobacteriaceae bacterium D16]
MKNLISKFLKLLPLLVFFAVIPPTEAQILKKLKKRTEKAAEEAVLQKTEEKVYKETSKGMDSILNPKTGKKEPAPAPDTSKPSKGDDDKSKQGGNTGSADTGSAVFEVYNKFDFVPGEKIKAFEDFSRDVLGDLPARWNTSNSVEVVSLSNQEGKWAQLGLGKGSFVPDFTGVLPDNFTLEYDLIINYDTSMGGFKPIIIANISDIENPNYDLNDQTPGKNGASFLIYGGVGDKGKLEFYKYAADKNLNMETPKDFSKYQYQNWEKGERMHISIWKQGRRLRVYLDEEKAFDIPRAFEASDLAKSFRFYSNIPKQNTNYFISNVRFAEGATDIRSKLLNEGRLVTYGITFDKGSAKLKPESYGVLKKVAQVLNENSSISIEVIGHTDADGSEAFNLDLSEKRARSVLVALKTSFNVNGEQLKATGKGETELLNFDNTPDAHAINRRVEFQIFR